MDQEQGAELNCIRISSIPAKGFYTAMVQDGRTQAFSHRQFARPVRMRETSATFSKRV